MYPCSPLIAHKLICLRPSKHNAKITTFGIQLPHADVKSGWRWLNLEEPCLIYFEIFFFSSLSSIFVYVGMKTKEVESSVNVTFYPYSICSIYWSCIYICVCVWGGGVQSLHMTFYIYKRMLSIYPRYVISRPNEMDGLTNDISWTKICIFSLQIRRRINYNLEVCDDYVSWEGENAFK